MSHLPNSEPSVQNGDAPGPTHSAGSRSEHASPSLSSADRAASELDVEVGTGVGAVPVSHDQPATALSLATHPDVGPPPDGGLEAWLCMIGGMLQMFCVFGFMMSNGQLQTYYLKHQLQGYAKSKVALLGSIQTFVEFAPAFITGRYFDVHGARTLIICGTSLAFGSTIGMAFSKEYYQILLSSLGFGLSGAFIYAPCTAVAAHWFLHRRGTALAVMTCGSGIGGIIYPVMLQGLFERLSYRDTLLIVAGFNLVLMLPSVFFLKARLPPRQPPPLSALKKPWHDPRYVFLVAGAAMYGTNLLSPYYNAIPVAASNNVASNITKYTVAITQAGSVTGRICTGILADRVGVWNVFGTIGFLSAAVMFAFWTPPNIGTAPTLIGLITWGYLSGAWFTLVGSATAHISPVHETGMRFGMLISSLAIPSLVGPLICGALFINNRFLYAGIFCGVCFLISGFLTVLSPLYASLKARRRPKLDGEKVIPGTEVIDLEVRQPSVLPEIKHDDHRGPGSRSGLPADEIMPK